MNDALAELTKAQAAVDKAQAHARQLEAEAAAREAEKKAKDDADNLAFDEYRKLNFRAELVAPLKDLRTAFEQTVISGGNSVEAWTTYIVASRAASGEERGLDQRSYDRALEHYQAVARAVNDWNTELSHTAHTGYTSAPKPAGITGQWYAAHVPGLSAQQMANQEHTKNRLEQINAEIAAVTKELGVNLHRQADDTSNVLLDEIIKSPNTPKATLMDGDRYEKRTYATAVEDAIRDHIATRTSEVGANRAAAFAEFKAKQGKQ